INYNILCRTLALYWNSLVSNNVVATCIIFNTQSCSYFVLCFCFSYVSVGDIITLPVISGLFSVARYGLHPTTSLDGYLLRHARPPLARPSVRTRKLRSLNLLPHYKFH